MNNEIMIRVRDAFPELNLLQEQKVVEVLDKFLNIPGTIESEILEKAINVKLDAWLKMVVVPVSEITEIAKETKMSRKVIHAYVQTMKGYLVAPVQYRRIGDKIVRSFVIYKK